MIKSKKKLIAARNKCKDAKIGEEISCPSCGTNFKKKAYNSVFCKSKRGTKCKDNFWNNVDENKRNNRTRISPASARWMASEERNLKKFGRTSPSVVGGFGRISGVTSEGYVIMDGTAYNEFDEPVYDVDPAAGDYDPGDSMYWDGKDF